MDLAPWRDYGVVTGADRWLDGAAAHGREREHRKGERIAGYRVYLSTYILQAVSITGLAATLVWIWFGG